MKIPCWLKHSWKMIHCEYTSYDKSHWFEHRKCLKCDKQIIYSHIPFFGNFNDAVKLGISEGFYLFNHPEIEKNYR